MKQSFLLFCIMFLAGCSEYSPGGAQPLRQEIKDFKIVELSGGTAQWELKADMAFIEGDNTSVEITNPEVKFFTDKKVSSYIKGKNGKLDMDKKDVELKKDVKIISYTENATLETQTLFYSGEKELIWSDTAVKMVQEGIVINGKGFQSKPDLSEIVIKNHSSKIPASTEKLKL